MIATQPVLPAQRTLTQWLSEGPPFQHLYEPPVWFVHGVVVQGTLVSGLLIRAIVDDEVLVLVWMLKE
ncbi:hypothetical protein [Streptomyces sp. NPDC001137]|uniref:hypothetical protein n=1 Tax=Streptomyces sp. NPDC001137 TaxID=3154378 RepID=UPI00332ACA80